MNSSHTNSFCEKYGNNHKGECKAINDVYFGFRNLGHRLKGYLVALLRRKDTHYLNQSNSLLTLAGRLTQQGASSSATGRQYQNRLNALQTQYN